MHRMAFGSRQSEKISRSYSRSDKPKNRLDEQIDDNLRRVYQTAASEPVPDRFTQLLDQLRKAEAEKPNNEADA